jgi:sialidase-1
VPVMEPFQASWRQLAQAIAAPLRHALPLSVLAISCTVSSGFTPASEPLFQNSVLFSSGQAGYFCFRIPALVVTGKGTVLAFAEARKTNCADWDEIDLVVKRSEDGGKTWSDLRALFHEDKRSINQPTPIVDRQTGSVVLVFCKDNQSVFVTHSSDDGQTWSQPREITERTKDPTWKYVAAGPGHGIQLSNGRLLLAAWGDTSPGPVTWPPTWGEIEFTFTIFSDDHGQTWQRGRPLYENATEEAMLAELTNRRVYMTLRSLHGKQRRGHAWSEDGGYSWSRIQFDENLPDPPAHASVIRIAGSGTNAADRFLFVNPANAGQRNRLTARMSEDDCATWPVAKVLYAGSSAYSDIAIGNDGTVLCLFEADEYSRLMFARFNLSWLVKTDVSESESVH